ncbi:MAG TPA: DUF1579 family protein [Kofleriaceae bacterium]|nr:DUF1579 family protein [Kofleriaceae bacterium]
MKLVVLATLAACASSPPPVTPTTVAPATAAPIAKVCAGPEFRQLDFWIGDWDVKIHSRATPSSEQWADAVGTQHVHPILSRCALEENFTAQAPVAFAGRSFSTYDGITKKWRQTWVDDTGGYIPLDGGPEGAEFALYGPPREIQGLEFQMRMVWSQITHDALRWEWQRSTDAWATHTLMMAIDYTRMK